MKKRVVIMCILFAKKKIAFEDSYTKELVHE